jgi:hypothetical protein
MQALVTCPYCPNSMQRASLPQHIMSAHNKFYKHDKRPHFHTLISSDPQTYTIDAPRRTLFPCPVPNCIFQTNSFPNMRSHFSHRHPFDTIIISAEGPLPRCESCRMFLSVANQPQHLMTQWCIDGTARHKKKTFGIEPL